MNRTIRVSALLVLMLTAFPLVLRAEDAAAPKPTTTPTTRHLRRSEIMEKLQMTPEQRKQLREYRAAYLKKRAEFDGQLKVKKVELESEMDKADPDAKKIAEICNQIGDIYGNRLNEKVNAKLELEKTILTPAQAKLLDALEDNGGADGGLGLTD